MSGVKPSNFGDWWNTNAKDVSWYQEIHDAREPIHDAFARWVAEHDLPHDPIRSILEIGCGRGVRYPALFADRRYVGYDISRKEIEWCRAIRHNSQHDYMVGDFITDGVGECFDLVFAHAVIDHVYDVDAFVRMALGATNRWLYLTAYRGWFPDLQEHRYSWSEQDTCFYNDLSPTRIQSVLTALGCRHVQVTPSEAEIQPIGRETLVIAERMPQAPLPRKADADWLQNAVVCPACLEGGILANRRTRHGGTCYECRRCRRIYPVDRFGVIDFQVHDRIALLPDGALEMWALAQNRSLEEYRVGRPARASTWDAAVKGFTGFLALDGARVLDVGAGADHPSRYVGPYAMQQYAALDPLPVGRDLHYTKVQAWAELIPFGDETFDVVVCGRSLEHFLCLESGLRELQRVLRRDGTLYLWVSLFGDAKSRRDLFPPLFERPVDDILPEDDGFDRRLAAIAEVTRRVGDVSRLEGRYGHLPVDHAHLRHVPLRILKTMPLHGFQPEVIDVWEPEFHFGSIVLNTFVRLRKSERGAPPDRSAVHQADLLAAAAGASERLQVVSDRLRSLEGMRSELASIRGDLDNMLGQLRGQIRSEVRADVLSDLRSELGSLRQALDYPRTPFERLYRGLSSWWHRSLQRRR